VAVNNSIKVVPLVFLL